MCDRPGKPYLTALGNLTDMVIIRSRLTDDDSWSQLIDRCAQEMQFTRANAVPANWICSWLKVELADFPVKFTVHQTGTTGHHSLLQDRIFDLIGAKQVYSGCMVHVFFSETRFEILVDHNPLILTTESVNDVIKAFADLLATPPPPTASLTGLAQVHWPPHVYSLTGGLKQRFQCDNTCNLSGRIVIVPVCR